MNTNQQPEQFDLNVWKRNHNNVILSIIGNVLLLSLIIMLIIMFHDENNCTPSIASMRIGPHNDLCLLSVKIDTIPKYVSLICIVICIRSTATWIEDIAHPILGDLIFGIAIKDIYIFTALELQNLDAMMSGVTSIRYMLMRFISIAQLDIAFIEIITSIITSWFTARMKLKDKVFHTNNNDIHSIEVEAVPLMNETHVINININN